jgi:uncharacterized SAM-binding protein YcdF (DUF218 family)
MFFVLSKTLYYLVMPAVWLLAVALWAVFTRSAARRKKLCIISLLLFFILGNEFLVNEVVALWERKGVPLENLSKEPYDVAIVLTGMTNPLAEPKDRVHLTMAADRIMHTVWLYREGRIKNILITGGSGSLLQEEPESIRLRKLLNICQVPDSIITIETASRNTRENALFSAEILNKKFPKQRYLLITSAFHSRRAEGCFAKAGVAFTPFPADFRSVPRSYTIDRILLPSENAFARWKNIIHEMVGYYTYKLMGYV